MKILIVNTYYYPNLIGGCEHSIKLLCEELVSLGHEVYVFTIDNIDSNGIKEEIINGVHVLRGYGGAYDIKVKLHLKRSITRKIANYLVEINNSKVLTEFEAVVRSIKPDIVHTNNLYGISFHIWKKCNDLSIPCIHTIRDYYIVSPLHASRGIQDKHFLRLAHLIYQGRFRRLSKTVPYITAPSRRTLGICCDEYGFFPLSKRYFVPNFVKIDQAKLHDVISRRKNQITNIVKFVYIGGLLRIKGVDLLLEQFCEIQNPNIRLIICGRGPLEPMVREAAGKDSRIMYYGQVSVDKRDEILEEADVAIVPSNYDEPFGRVVIECNYAGLPVIGSDLGGIKEIIETIHTGELFDVNKPQTLKERIEEFAAPDHIKGYYDAILENLQLYSSARIVDQFAHIYAECIEAWQRKNF